MSLDFPSLQDSSLDDGLWNSIDPASQFNSNYSNINHLLISDQPGMPETTTIHELVDLFFAHSHRQLYCIDRDMVLQGLDKDNIASNPLIWAIMVTAAPAHPKENIRSSQQGWRLITKILIDVNMCTAKDPLDTLQAAVWLVYHSYTVASMAKMLAILGSARRFASFLGWDRMDSNRTTPSSFVRPAGNPIE